MNILIKISNLLKRNTGKNKLIPEIDGLRTLALMPVIFMHFNTNYKRYLGDSLGDSYDNIINNGDRGVLLFFAISGFILTFAFYNLFKKGLKINYKDYFVRRLTRLEPPFLICILILFIVVQYNYEGGIKALLPHLMPTLTYTHHLIFGDWSPINPVTWSLEVEIQFYILVPLFSTFIFKFNKSIRILILCVLLILFPLIFLDKDSFFLASDSLKRSLPIFINYFIIGLLFLEIFTSEKWNENKSSLWDFIGIISIGLFLFYEFESSRIVECYYVSLLILLIMISIFKGKIINKIFTYNPIVIFGGMCYSIYLIHYPVFFGISKVSKYFIFDNNYLNYTIQFLLSFSLMFLLASLFFVFFEKPFMKKDWWKNNKI